MRRRLFVAFWLIGLLAFADPMSPGKLHEIKASLQGISCI